MKIFNRDETSWLWWKLISVRDLGKQYMMEEIRRKSKFKFSFENHFLFCYSKNKFNQLAIHNGSLLPSENIQLKCHIVQVPWRLVINEFQILGVIWIWSNLAKVKFALLSARVQVLTVNVFWCSPPRPNIAPTFQSHESRNLEHANFSKALMNMHVRLNLQLSAILHWLMTLNKSIVRRLLVIK